jgi:hypothetical protein
MDKTLKIYLAALLGVILLVVFIDMSRTKPVDWTPTYSLDNKNPLDLYVFNHEVNKIIPKDRLKRVTVTPFEYFRNNDGGKANYLIINQNVYDLGDSLLLDEVKNGSNLWVSAENFIKFFTDTLQLKYSYVDLNLSLKSNDSIKLTLSMKNWHDKYFYLHPAFNTFSFVNMNAATTTILGKTQMPDNVVYPNFVRVKYGNGFIFVHTQPEVFTNMALLAENSSADYVAHILSYILQDKPVVWFVKDQTHETGEPVNETALSVVFRYPALRMTWLLFIYGMLLYLLFNAKRRQRIVPVVKPLRNTTVEFVQTIGNLYFQEGHTPSIVEKKIIYFLDRIRIRYHLDTSKLDDSFVEKLHGKSGKDKELIASIVSFINEFERKKFAIQVDLVRLSNMIEEFWKDAP